jgi:hypothetical protein
MLYIYIYIYIGVVSQLLSASSVESQLRRFFSFPTGNSIEIEIPRFQRSQFEEFYIMYHSTIFIVNSNGFEIVLSISYGFEISILHHVPYL